MVLWPQRERKNEIKPAHRSVNSYHFRGITRPLKSIPSPYSLGTPLCFTERVMLWCCPAWHHSLTFSFQHNKLSRAQRVFPQTRCLASCAGQEGRFSIVACVRLFLLQRFRFCLVRFLNLNMNIFSKHETWLPFGSKKKLVNFGVCLSVFIYLLIFVFPCLSLHQSSAVARFLFHLFLRVFWHFCLSFKTWLKDLTPLSSFFFLRVLTFLH